jgi:hypothetical protein
MDGLHIAAYVTAGVTAAGFLIVAARMFVGTGKLVTVVEGVPAAIDVIKAELKREMSGIREELRTSNENTLRIFEQHTERFGEHSERLAVVEAMLNLDDSAQAKEGPMRRRRGRGGREI